MVDKVMKVEKDDSSLSAWTITVHLTQGEGSLVMTNPRLQEKQGHAVDTNLLGPESSVTDTNIQ